MELSDKMQDVLDRIGPGWDKYLDIPESWYSLVEEVYDRLVAIDPFFTVQQVKEKFGELRFYAEPSEGLSDEDIFLFNSLCDQASTASHKIPREYGNAV